MGTIAKRRLKAADNLRNARKLIGVKSRWIQGYLANDKGGKQVSPSSSKAVAWCAVGAIRHAGGSALEERALNRVTKDQYGLSVVELNDSNGDASRKKILKAMTVTAAKLEQEAANL